jgi:hypothetical protein
VGEQPSFPEHSKAPPPCDEPPQVRSTAAMQGASFAGGDAAIETARQVAGVELAAAIGGESGQ